MSRSIDIDRKTAGELLNVSVRTIDRYVRAGKLSARYINGRVLLDKKEIIRLRPILGGNVIPTEYINTEPERPTQITNSNTNSRPTTQNDFYKDLYEESKLALREYNQELQNSKFKIGQLESQLKFHTENPQHKEEITTQPTAQHVQQTHSNPGNSHQDVYTLELLRKEIRDREQDLRLLKESLEKEKNTRLIFTILTYALLILQPIFWFLLK